MPEAGLPAGAVAGAEPAPPDVGGPARRVEGDPLQRLGGAPVLHDHAAPAAVPLVPEQALVGIALELLEGPDHPAHDWRDAQPGEGIRGVGAEQQDQEVPVDVRGPAPLVHAHDASRTRPRPSYDGSPAPAPRTPCERTVRARVARAGPTGRCRRSRLRVPATIVLPAVARYRRTAVTVSSRVRIGCGAGWSKYRRSAVLSRHPTQRECSMTRTTRTARGLAVVAALALTVAGCGGGSSGNGPSANGDGNKPVDGGTLTFLTLQDQLQHLDPQRNYTGEDLAFANGYIQRTLTAYKYSPDGTTSTELTPGPRHRHGHGVRRGEDLDLHAQGRRDVRGRLAHHLRRREVRRLAHVRDRHHHRRSDVRDLDARHPLGQGRELRLQGPVRHQGQRHRGVRQGGRVPRTTRRWCST